VSLPPTGCYISVFTSLVPYFDPLLFLLYKLRMAATAEKLFFLTIGYHGGRKAYVCSCLITGNEVSNPADDMNVRLLSLYR